MGGPEKRRRKDSMQQPTLGGKSSREEVSSKHLIFGFVLQCSDRFLVSLDSFMLNNARFSLEAPRSCLVDCCCQVLGRVGKVA
jgi:hypothetical protein